MSVKLHKNDNSIFQTIVDVTIICFLLFVKDLHLEQLLYTGEGEFPIVSLPSSPWFLVEMGLSSVVVGTLVFLIITDLSLVSITADVV